MDYELDTRVILWGSKKRECIWGHDLGRYKTHLTVYFDKKKTFIYRELRDDHTVLNHETRNGF